MKRCSSLLPSTAPGALAPAIDFIDDGAAARLPHGPGCTLRDHLVGTLQILSHWAQPQEVIAAGLLHSVYGTDVYRPALVSLADRAKVSAVAGAAAERLAYLFCILRRDSLFASAAKARPGRFAIAVECHRRPATERLTGAELGALLVIHMANAAEQGRADDGSPGSWVSAASRWGRWAKPLLQRAPPVFDDCVAAVAPTDERAALAAYGRALPYVASNPAAAAAELLTAAERLPWMAEPVVLAGYCALQRGQWIDAFQYADHALRLLAHWGTAWDKRLSYAQWKAATLAIAEGAERAFADPAHAKVLQESRSPGNDWRDALVALAAPGQEGIGKTSTTGASGVTPAPELPPRFVSYLAGFYDARRSGKHNFYPGLRRRAIHPAAEFPVAKALEAHYAEVRAEFERLRGNDGFQREPEGIGRTGQWNVFMLYELGKRNDANCTRCPVTTALIERHAAVRSICNAAYFSILAPNTRVAPHKGPTNMRLRCHLGIDVPDGCALRVGGERLTWREGKCLVFDDSLTHEVWNDGSRPRVALVVDLWHPELSRAEVALLDELQRYAFTHARDMSAYWVRSERARAAFRSPPVGAITHGSTH